MTATTADTTTTSPCQAVAALCYICPNCQESQDELQTVDHIKLNYLHLLKEAQYIVQTLMGLSWLGFSVYLFCKPDANLICDTVPAILMFITGSVCVFFGVEAYLLRDDPEIWR